jgi:transcriptional regulator with XRE-family HTH domain
LFYVGVINCIVVVVKQNYNCDVVFYRGLMGEYPHKDIGERLKKLRGKMSQGEFAALLGIKQQQYNRYETGKNRPPYPILTKIADHAQVSTDWILTGNITDDPVEQLKRSFINMGRKWRELRGERSLEKVSIDTGIPVETLIMFENGEASPGPGPLAELCKYFDVTRKFIFGDHKLGDHTQEAEGISVKAKQSASAQEKIEKRRHSPLVEAIVELLIALPEEDMVDVLNLMTSEIFKRAGGKEGKLLGEFFRRRNRDKGDE